MLNNELAFSSAIELQRAIAEKQVSPVEVTELYLSRIEKLDSHLNSYLTLSAEEAIRSAKAAEEAVMRGDWLPPLHGVPIAIKDLEATKGIRTTAGSLVFEDRIPEEDSIVVGRIKDAGAIILGKTNTPEFGLLAITENRLGDHCRNPWDTNYSAGGSSGGSAASVSAGLCSLAVGSDGGGSIRIPASFCGVYGIKPTQGRVPRYSGAAMPIVANQFSQSGPMTRTVRDSALLLQVLGGYDSRDVSSLRKPCPDFLKAACEDINGLKVGWSPDFGHAVVEPEIVEIVFRAAKVFEELGCSLDSSDLTFESQFEVFWTLFSANNYAIFGHLLKEDRDELTWYVSDGLESGSKVSGSEYSRAIGQLNWLETQFAKQFERYDLLLSPTMATDTCLVDGYPKEIAGSETESIGVYTPFTFPINMVGYPAASIPCGFLSNGLPLGLQIIGRKGDESTVIAASAAFELAKPWIHQKPLMS